LSQDHILRSHEPITQR